MTHLFTDKLTAKHSVIMQHDKSTFVETELFTNQEVQGGAWYCVSFYCTQTQSAFSGIFLTFSCNYVWLMNKTYKHKWLLRGGLLSARIRRRVATGTKVVPKVMSNNFL